MLNRFNLFCNIAILTLLLGICIYALWRWKENLNQKAAIVEQAKKNEAAEKEYNVAIAKQNMDIKKQLLADYNSCSGVFICFRESSSVAYMKPLWIKIKYNVLYPIKGDLNPGDSISAKNVVEALDNGSFFDFWTQANHVRPPIDIVFIYDDPLDSNARKTKIETHPYTKNALLRMVIPLDGGEQCKLFKEVLKEIGWDIQTPYFKSTSRN